MKIGLVGCIVTCCCAASPAFAQAAGTTVALNETTSVVTASLKSGLLGALPASIAAGKSASIASNSCARQGSSGSVKYVNSAGKGCQFNEVAQIGGCGGVPDIAYIEAKATSVNGGTCTVAVNTQSGGQTTGYKLIIQ
jgi:hypothetical protein